MNKRLAFRTDQICYYKQYEIGYELNTGDIYVSKHLGDIYEEQIQVPTIDEAYEYIDSLYEKS